ncbi:MAG: polysaccharide biosynthesis/export family protein [Campylobacteraceae bacterium]|nr:polysaccharide biosynthesis/export family protein [Campylobacteraceae bacterium]
MKKFYFSCIIAFGFTCNVLALDLGAIAKVDLNTTAEKSSNGVFGEHLFNGNFSKVVQHVYNPDYRIGIGDVVTLKMWGAFNYEQPLNVDSQGNIFIPSVGTVQLLGVRNGELVNIITEKVKKVYKENVFVYADMGAYQNVSVFVTGNVNNPGLYQGLSSDSLMQYIDKAYGINPKQGSFRKISILRENKLYKKIDLYDFLLQGQMELFAFRSGDVILVESVGSYISAAGEVLRPLRFESKELTMTLKELAKLSGIKPTATNAVVKSYGSDNRLSVQSYPLDAFESVTCKAGDTVEFMPDYLSKEIQVAIEGEHDGLHTLVLKKGITLLELKKDLHFNTRSNIQAIQVYRKSVAQMQKKLIEAQLKELETLALTTPSVTPQEATMRTQESKAILEFIERAKKVEPKGQIVINEKTPTETIVLEEGDTISIPTHNNIIIVQGEVALPGAFTYADGQNIDDYIAQAGDLSERANKERILVIKASGKAEKYDTSLFTMSGKPTIDKGDAILILPKAEGKSLQVTSMLSQILYHIAVATKVVLDI